MLAPISTFDTGTIYLHEECDACNGVAVLDAMIGEVVFCGTMAPTEEELQIVYLTHSNTEPLWEANENASVIVMNATMLPSTKLSMALAYTNEALLLELEKLLPVDNKIRLLRESIRAQNGEEES